MPFRTIRYALLGVSIGAFIAAVSNVVAQEDPCYGDPACYNQPPPGSNPPSAPPWDGLSDGRLNPDPAEYYSVYCPFQTDRIEVLRSVPPPTVLVDAIPLADVIALSTGGSLARASGLTIARTDDTITLSGANGNLAPQSGVKVFSLSQCIERNGRAPDASSAENSATGNDGPCQGITDPQEYQECVEDQVSVQDFRERQEAERQTIEALISAICTGNSSFYTGIVILPGGLALLRRRRRGKKRCL